MTELAVVIPAWNEQENIGATLNRLTWKNQERPPDIIVVVNDGSTDKTAEIVKEWVFKMRPITLIQHCLPKHEKTEVSRPHLAKVINKGLLTVQHSDYVCILGADHQLPREYFNFILKKMEEDPQIVIASGQIYGEDYIPDFPSGSGRLIRSQWFRKFGFQFPEEYGWEDWIVYKAKKEGLKTIQYKEVTSILSRPMSYKRKGEIMYALGYYPPYALGRCLKFFLKDPSTGFDMLKGYVLHRGVKRLEDIADYVRDEQKKKIWMMAKKKIMHEINMVL